MLAAELPKEPGVYRFIDADGEILYVGKAKNLKNRLQSYFVDSKGMSYKARIMVRHSARFEFTIVETEHDALLLENTLIKKHQPRYNVMLKDDKAYTYIVVKKERFPRVFFTRRVIRDGSTYYGPYTSKYSARIVLDMIRNLFPLRTCTLNLSEENIRKGKFKVCLEYHIKNCMGPCEDLESEADYMEKIQQVKNMLNGQFAAVTQHLKKQMKWHAEHMEFEKAQQAKIKLEAFQDYQSKSTVVSTRIRDVDVFSIAGEGDTAFVNYIRVINGAVIHTYTQELIKNLDQDEADILAYTVWRLRERFSSLAPEIIAPIEIPVYEEGVKVTVPNRGEKKKLLEMSEKNVSYFLRLKKKEEVSHARRQTSAERILKTLQQDLNMDEVPLHIECFDNSNFQGSNPVSSCVVFKNARPSKKDYRHFHIKTVQGPDDFASMAEVVHRRYKRLLELEEPLPQLIIIDGGKGQLSAAVESLKGLGIDGQITVIGIAKRLEEIFFPNDSVPLYINKKSESLKLIQQARNEAHRFAITFHRNSRSRDFTRSTLEMIPGVGEKRADQLLRHFGSVKKIQLADEPTLAGVVGKALAASIARFLHSGEEE
jgi:excinuclease ABC subunit C